MSIFYFSLEEAVWNLSHNTNGTVPAMRYDVRYKIISTIHKPWLSKESNPFPVLAIKYRKSGKGGRWILLGSAKIDLFACVRFRNTWYRDLAASTTPLEALENKSDYERLTRFMEILEKEFGGSMDLFVRNLVEVEIAMQEADKAERRDVQTIISSVSTNGWKDTCASVNV